MSKISKIFEVLHARFDYRRPIYDPNYTYAPWKKRVLWGTVALLLLFIIVGSVGGGQSSGGEGDANVQTQKNQGSPGGANLKQAPSDAKYYLVSRVVDGDTVDVTINGKVERLRLIGVDTPETVDPRKTVQCFGREASARAKKLLTGQSVRLEADSTQGNRDKYNRLLRYVFLKDGTNFNKMMIADGYAHEYTYYIPYKYQAAFKAAENDARKNERGLWSPSTCAGDTTSQATQNTSTAQEPTSTQNSSDSTECNPNYTPCVPNVSYDLNCSDINFSVTVVGTDVYRFDRDGDGYGCESN